MCLFLLFVTVLVRCTTDIADGGSDLPDKIIVTGSIYTIARLPAVNTLVMIIPVGYNSLKDAPIPEIRIDATENHFDGTAENMNASSSVSGAIGNARKFDGISAFIRMSGTAGSSLSFPQHGTYSVSAWVNIDSLAGEYQMIASKGDKQYNLQFRGETKNWQFTEYQDTVGWDETVSGATAREWVYLVGVRSDVKQYLYVNGCVPIAVSITSLSYLLIRPVPKCMGTAIQPAIS